MSKTSGFVNDIKNDVLTFGICVEGPIARAHSERTVRISEKRSENVFFHLFDPKFV